jgi:hypothetical protein
MVKKKQFSDIDMEMLPFFETKLRSCEVCDEYLTDRDKMVIFDDSGTATLFSCRFCSSVYSDSDTLVIVNVGSGDMAGES